MRTNTDLIVKQSYGYRIAKRCFDLLFSSCVLMVSLVPGIVIAALIVIQTKGSPIYTQERVGQHGKLFNLYKLRSMVADADNVKKYLNDIQLSQWKAERKVDNDPRITSIGKLIRKTSLDELPQFINVLKGDMSIIGPRAITIHELEQWFTKDEQSMLLSVPQGITGWWQVQKRNKATFESGERQSLELWYARNASMKVDCMIFIKTFSIMFGKKRTGR